MNKKIKIVIFFLVGFLVLDQALYTGLSYLHRKSDWHLGFTNDPKIIYLGNSRTHRGISPKTVEKVTGLPGHNIAQFGAGILYSKGIASVILEEHDPGYFVVQSMNLAGEKGAVYFLAPYFNNSDVKALLEYYPFNKRILYSLSKSIRYNSWVLKIVKHLFFHFESENGYVPFHGSVLDLEEAKLTEEPLDNEIKNLTLPSYELNAEQGKKLLVSLVEEAKANNVQIVFYEPPVYTGEKSSHHAVYKAVAKEYDIPFFDFSGTSEEFKRFGRGAYRDRSHLKHEGAVILSNLLARKLRNLQHPTPAVN